MFLKYFFDKLPRYGLDSRLSHSLKRRGHCSVQYSLPDLKTLVIQLQVDLPLVDGSYKWADGKSVGVYDSTVVAIHTDHPDGIVG